MPFHDLLVQGHEGTHDLISRNRRVNDFFTWFTLAFAGISAEAHRRFHLDHHHHAHSAKDPEYQFFNQVVRGVPGWAYFLIPAFAQIGVNAYGLRPQSPAAVRRRIVLELFAGVALHLGIAVLLGWGRYLIFVIAPMLSGLYVASVLRSVTEHHDVTEGSVWTNARSIITHPALEFLWSNVNYHLEHHLYPSVPFTPYQNCAARSRQNSKLTGARWKVAMAARLWRSSRIHSTSPRGKRMNETLVTQLDGERPLPLR